MLFQALSLLKRDAMAKLTLLLLAFCLFQVTLSAAPPKNDRRFEQQFQQWFERFRPYLQQLNGPRSNRKTRDLHGFGHHNPWASLAPASPSYSNGPSFKHAHAQHISHSSKGGFNASPSSGGFGSPVGFGSPSAVGYGSPSPVGFGSPPGGFGAASPGGFGAASPGGFGAASPGGFGYGSPGGFAPSPAGFGPPQSNQFGYNQPTSFQQQQTASLASTVGGSSMRLI